MKSPRHFVTSCSILLLYINICGFNFSLTCNVKKDMKFELRQLNKKFLLTKNSIKIELNNSR